MTMSADQALETSGGTVAAWAATVGIETGFEIRSP
jgi:hypothetical protein